MNEDAHLEMQFEDSISGGHDYEADMLAAEMEAEAMASYWDDDPNPYHGDYSEC